MATSKHPYTYRPSAKWTRAATRRAAEEHAQHAAEAQKPSRRTQPSSGGGTVVTTPVEQPISWRLLCHPALSTLSELEFEIRSSILSRLINRVPQEEWINWYGGLIRDDGGNGMYATEALADAWPRKQDQGDITIGPG